MYYFKKYIALVFFLTSFHTSLASRYFDGKSFYLGGAGGKTALNSSQKATYSISSQFSLGVLAGFYFSPNWSFEVGGISIPDATINATQAGLKKAMLYYSGLVISTDKKRFRFHVKFAPVLQYSKTSLTTTSSEEDALGGGAPAGAPPAPAPDGAPPPPGA